MKVLVLSTYPISEPIHGGQHRVRNIVNAYLKSGFDVKVAGVLGSDYYRKENGFVSYPGAILLSSIVEDFSIMVEYAISRLSVENESLYENIKKNINFCPDLIHVEQPWLFLFAIKFRQELDSYVPVIYGSQNIEWELKKKIISSSRSDKKAEYLSNLVKEVEEFAIKESDAIICVSENDCNWVRRNTSAPVLLAQNGVNDAVHNEKGTREAGTVILEKRYALYCASAHPPNATGFFEIFGGGFGSLKPDEELVVVGEVGELIANDDRIHKSAKLAEKTKLTFVVSQECLTALLHRAHCIILPLTQGGGTNLKTAEALWAGKHIVATTFAMQGFEQFIGSPGVVVKDDPISFKKALRQAMEQPSLKLSADEIKRRKVVLWENCLSELPDFVEVLVKGHHE